MTTFNAQEYLNKKLDKEQETIISGGSLRLLAGEKLTGDLIIQDYPQLEEIDLKNHELTSLTISNCPQLKQINVRNNQLTKLEISEDNQMEEIIAGSNELTSLNLVNCQKISKLIIPDNPLLSELENLNLSTIKNINLANTLVSLTESYETLKRENENLLKIVKVVNEGAVEKPFVLTQAIQTPAQLEEAIQRLLAKTEREWREYFANPQLETNPILHLRLQSSKNRRKAKEILLQVVQTQTSKNYQELVKEWKKGESYDSEYDFDNSLDRLKQYLEVRNYNQKRELTGL